MWKDKRQRQTAAHPDLDTWRADRSGPAAYWVQPASRGAVQLASADPFAAPPIDAAFLGDPADAQTLIRALKIAHRITSTPALSPHKAHMHPAPCTRRQ